jgi:Tol biopolymer transport system component/serine/threonine protein kinase
VTISPILLRFGPFEANCHTGELRNGDARIQLAPQSFQLLVLLAERAGELVTRDEIQQVLWPNETIVEFDHSINTAVKRIRAALNDSKVEPRYLETLPRRGYRFLAKVERVQLAAPPVAPAIDTRITYDTISLPGEKELVSSEPAGKTISHYRVGDLLGRGGMGVVYRAEDLRLGRQVALKFLVSESEFDPVAKSRFEREARMASALNHPNICTIYDIELDTSGGFIAMELLEGETLRERLKRDTTLFGGKQVVDLGIQIANALEAAHESGVIHRDIKPANIFITRRGEVKVLDFGIAKSGQRRRSLPGTENGSHQHGTEPDLTGGGLTPGTKAYMSPEQANGEELDSRTDLYSLGATLYEAATGQAPAALHHGAARPLSIPANYPPKLGEIIGRLLDPDRELRYQTAGDLASELKRLKRDLSSDPQPLPPVGKQQSGAGDESPAPPSHRKRTRNRTVQVLSAVLVLIAVIFGGRWLSVRPRPETPLLAERLTTDPGYHIAADFSPDGKQIVYCWNGNDEKNYDLYVLAIAGGEARRLTTDPMIEFSPAWSPDGRNIAFLEGPPEGVATLMMMPADGGTPKKVADTSTRVGPLNRRLSWSRDGRWIVVEDESSPEDGYRLIALSVSTGERRRLTHPGANRADLEPSISPDGRTLAFVRDVGNGVSIPCLLSLNPDMTDPAEPHPLRFQGFENTLISYPRWTDNRNLIFVAIRGAHRLWRAPAQEHSTPLALASLGEDASFPAISPDGKRLVFSRSFVNAHLWSVETEPSATPPLELSGLSIQDSVPEFSPDGSRMVFRSERSGSSEIWVSAPGGVSARALTHYGGPITGSPHWSPDGKWIVYDSRVEGQPDIYVIPSAGGDARRLTFEPADDVMPIWSPDGRWIYFCSDRSGSRQVWRIPSGGGQAEQITRNGGFAAVLSPDGKTLYYMKHRGTVSPIWTAPAQGGDETLVVNNVLDRCFIVSGRRLYFAARNAGEELPSLYSLDLSRHHVVLVRALAGVLFSGLSVMPDGNRLLYRQVDRRGSNLMLVNDFR